jgi:hypothetical protein
MLSINVHLTSGVDLQSLTDKAARVDQANAMLRNLALKRVQFSVGE